MKSIRLTAAEFAEATGQPMPAKEAARVRAGRQAQKKGQRFEDELDAAHDRLRTNGIADIFKLPVPTRQVGRQLIRVHRQRCDYVGFLAGGRGVVMEAKSFEHTSMPIIPDTYKGRGIKTHQLKALKDAQAWGCVAVLVWKCGDRLLRFTAFDSLATDARSIPIAAFERLDRLEEWIEERLPSR